MNDAEPKSAQSLTVVVVTYGQPETVRSCLASVEACSGEVSSLRAAVVDNNSPDDVPDVVAREFPNVELIRSSTNDGFAVANNKVLRGVTSDLVLLLNPDCVLQPGCLSKTANYLQGHADVGVVGCRLVTSDGQNDHAAKRNIPSPREAVKYFLGDKKSDYLAPDVGEFDVGEVDAVNGAFMMVRTEAMRQVGLLDERYWMYAEDLDWCLRFKKASWKVVYFGKATCVHLKSKITGSARSPRLNWHFHRSMAIFYRENLKDHNPIVNWLIVSAIYARMVVKVGQDSATRWLVAHRASPQSSPTRVGE